MATPKNIRDCRSVDTAADFVAFLDLLADDYDEDVARAKASGDPCYEGSWVNRDLGMFLDGWAR